MTPSVTIIIPTYNRASTLPQAVEAARERDGLVVREVHQAISLPSSETSGRRSRMSAANWAGLRD